MKPCLVSNWGQSRISLHSPSWPVHKAGLQLTVLLPSAFKATWCRKPGFKAEFEKADLSLRLASLWDWMFELATAGAPEKPKPFCWFPPDLNFPTWNYLNFLFFFLRQGLPQCRMTLNLGFCVHLPGTGIGDFPPLQPTELHPQPGTFNF